MCRSGIAERWKDSGIQRVFGLNLALFLFCARVCHAFCRHLICCSVLKSTEHGTWFDFIDHQARWLNLLCLFTIVLQWQVHWPLTEFATSSIIMKIAHVFLFAFRHIAVNGPWRYRRVDHIIIWLPPMTKSCLARFSATQSGSHFGDPVAWALSLSYAMFFSLQIQLQKELYGEYTSHLKLTRDMHKIVQKIDQTLHKKHHGEITTNLQWFYSTCAYCEYRRYVLNDYVL